ncbi:MAG: ABC transporter permease [Mobilicoccus sp.]|nr:ABC transporter permease [Mobilicoccus sp.]
MSSAWTLVAQREISVKLRNKSFLVSTAFTLVLVLAVTLLPMLLGGMFGQGDTTYRVAVVDSQGRAVVQQADGAQQTVVSPLGNGDADTTVEAVDVADRAAAEAAVLDGSADAALVHDGTDWQLLADGSAPMQLTATLGHVVQVSAMERNAQQAGTSVAELMAGTTLVPVDLSPQAQDGTDPVLGELMDLFVGLAFGMLFYMAAIMFGMQIAQSVVEEKQSRIVEILAAMIPTRALLVGKVIGNTLLALAQIVLIAAVALFGLSFTDIPLDLSGLTEAILWYVPFFVLGFLALACVWAAAGAMAARNEDLQSTTMPLTVILIAVFIVGINASGTVATVMSFIPVASTIVMPMRIVAGDYEVWEPVVALALVLLCCVVTIWFGSRLYERAILHTGGSLSWRKAATLKA